MKKSAKQTENYCPDKTYQNHAGSGTIKTSKSNSKRNESSIFALGKSNKEEVKAKKEIKQCYNRALISVRKRKTGYLIVVTRQPNTTLESYALAKQLQSEMNEELKANDYFVDDYDDFTKWFNEKEIILKDNGFHKLKG